MSYNWLLLLHQLPPKPAYARAKILRRLNQLGALPVKNAAYLLPANESTLEDFQWTQRQIEEDSGESWLFRVKTVSGLSDESIVEAFRELRKPDYAELIEAARQLLSQPNETEWRRLAQRYSDLRRIDFFDAPGSEEMETLMNRIDRALHPAQEPTVHPDLAQLRGCTWVTRRGIKVDRMSSAWLIRRFIDPNAVFVFVDPASYTHSPGEVRFDMFEGEFTHSGDMCTFEALLALSAQREDAPLRAIAEVVHDIDLREQKYQRPETAGIALMIDGIVRRHSDDARRLEEGSALFESLFASLSAR